MSLYVDNTFELFDADEATFLIASVEYVEIDIQHYTEEVDPSERAIGTLSVLPSSGGNGITIRGSDLIFNNFTFTCNGEIVFRGRTDNTCNITTESLSIDALSAEGLYLYPYIWQSVIMTQTSGIASASNCILEGIQTSGGATFISLVSNGCVDYGGNDGWIWYETPQVETYNGTNLGVTSFTGQGEIISVGLSAPTQRGFISSTPSASLVYETDCSSFDGYRVDDYNPVQLLNSWLFEYIESIDSYPGIYFDESLPISLSNIFDLELTITITSLVDSQFWFDFEDFVGGFWFGGYFSSTSLFLYQYDIGDYVDTEIPTPYDGEHIWKFKINSTEGWETTSCSVYIDNVFQSSFPVGSFVGTEPISSIYLDLYGDYTTPTPPTTGFSVTVNYINMYDNLTTMSFYEEGTFGTGTYSLPITGCEKLTTNYIQAFAENEYGISYGSIVTVTLVSDEYVFTNVQGNHTIGVNFIYLGGD